MSESLVPAPSAMAKTAKPLTILLDAQWLEYPAIEELRRKGHTLVPFDPTVDLVISGRAHFWIDAMFEAGYLEVALKRARKTK